MKFEQDSSIQSAPMNTLQTDISELVLFEPIHRSILRKLWYFICAQPAPYESITETAEAIGLTDDEVYILMKEL